MIFENVLEFEPISITQSTNMSPISEKAVSPTSTGRGQIFFLGGKICRTVGQSGVPKETTDTQSAISIVGHRMFAPLSPV